MIRKQLQALKARLPDCQGSKRFYFSRQIRRLEKQSITRGITENDKKLLESLKNLDAKIGQSADLRTARLRNLPSPEYPETLPVAARRADIIKQIKENQVTIICGETGSGKTTQLPKMCLELGRGVDGLIGHTQPRRLAARSVARRIAEELKSELGSLVGYKVRFHDKVSPDSYIKLMTDGILLAEIRNDRYLNQYDTLIVDEAHERSLNIDFLLGYLRWLLPRRKDLKVIITSATIDPQLFARHFSFNGKDAPVIEVSGRTYPVETRYHPLIPDKSDETEEQSEKEMLQAIIDASDELMHETPGGILVFLPGEREIREASDALRKHHKASVEILPLFARLSSSDQNRIFQPTRAWRIVLSTNVAETSLTVPGIRYVIDTGLARISRYSWRSRVQRLPIEKISQASANQRSGRCGRTSNGIAIRLYSEDDFLSRAEFTQSEILRTNLASVILQLASFNLGNVYDFPYVEAPDSGMIRDGYKLLFELGAVNKLRGEQIRLTKIGQQLAGLPIDPRLGRMLLAAHQLGVTDQVLVIASALSVQDVRERPMDKQQASDQKHSRFKHARSDFISLLNLWDYYHDKNGQLSQNQLRKLCHREFLSFVRLREWNEIYHQLRLSLKNSRLLGGGKPLRQVQIGSRKGKKKLEKSHPVQLHENPNEAFYEKHYESIHQSLLTGLLSNIGYREERLEYLGANNRKYFIFPASGLFKHPPKWVMAAELVETSRLFARTVAAIQPDWVEQAGKHLLHYHYSEPRWEKRPAQVAADERSSLYGITINPRKRVNFGPIDPEVSRQLFIRHALVYGEFNCKAPFFTHNRGLIEEVETLEAKSRRRDILVDEEILYDFYDRLIPQSIYNGPAFETWRKKIERDSPDALLLTRDFLMQRDDSHVQEEKYPDHINVAGMSLPLGYHFEPGSPQDGVSVKIPAAALNQITSHTFDYLVPGMLEEKIIEFIRNLPKQVRKQFVPAPEYARACLEWINDQVLHSARIAPNADSAERMPIVEAISQALKRMTGVSIDEELLVTSRFSDHMLMRYEVLDEAGKVIRSGRNLEKLKKNLAYKAGTELSKIMPGEQSIEKSGITRFDFDPLPESVIRDVKGMKIKAWPALVDEKDSVAIRLFDTPQKAKKQRGLVRLVLLHFRQSIRESIKQLPEGQKLCLWYASTGRCDELKRSIVENSYRMAFFSAGTNCEPSGAGLSREQFDSLIETHSKEVLPVLQETIQQLATILLLNHQIRKQLKNIADLSLLEAINDIQDQLKSLIYPGFLDHLSLEELRQLPRYLKAILRRLEKLAGEAHKDRALRLQIAPLWDDYKQLLGQSGWSDKLQEYRWMLEEFRVSLFAQELGTAYPVSAKRLSRHWKELSKQIG